MDARGQVKAMLPAAKPQTAGAPFVAFSIASRNYMCFASALYESLVRQYGEVRFFLALADSDEALDCASLPYEILRLRDLEDDRVWGMAERYNITEFNTSIKPFVFAQLIERFPDLPILYFDPDILVVSRLQEIEEAFDNGANAVLTPHLIDPLDHAWSHDEDMLKYGIYNLGFLGLRGTPEGARLVNWWCDRMERRCLIDFPNGLFVDQKWCDFIPAYLPNTQVLRHPGYNVAYWNLPHREVRYANRRWTCNGEDLRFVHFSGVDILNPAIISRHAANFHHSVVGDLGHLLESYREKVLQSGFKRYGRFEYAFRYSGATGALNVHTAVSLSDKLKNDTGAVDHALPAFGNATAEVANSLGQVQPAPALLADTVHSSQALMAWEKKHADTLQIAREFEKELLAKSEGIVIAGGVCAMCRTTSPLLAEVKTSKRLRTCDWNGSMTCRCGHSAETRALVHAARSIAGIGPDDRVLIASPCKSLLDWASLHWPKSDLLDAAAGAAQCILVKGQKRRAGSGLLAQCLSQLASGGWLFMSGDSQVDATASDDAPGIDFLWLEAMKTEGFADARCIIYWSKDLGYLGPRRHLFVARKTSNTPVRLTK